MLLCGVQEPWIVQELADCVEGSINGRDLNCPCLELMSDNRTKIRCLQPYA